MYFILILILKVCRGSRSVNVTVCQRYGLSVLWSVNLMVCQAYGLSMSRSVIIFIDDLAKLDRQGVNSYY